MAEVVVSGTLSEILEGMIKIREAIRSRKDGGWEPFQEDEEYEYETRRDRRVCPQCEQFGMTRRFSGDRMLADFPDLVQRNPPTYTVVRPRVHITFPEWKPAMDRLAEGGCRCRLDWIDPQFTLANRLTFELQRVIL